MLKTNRKSTKRIKNQRVLAASILVFSLNAFANNSNNTIYQFHFLEGLGGSNSYARDINNNGKIVGYSDTLMQSQRATLWDNFLASDLGTLGGANSQANAINNNDLIVGWSENDGNDVHGVRWNQPNVILDLGSLNNTGSRNNNLNNLGIAVGNDGIDAVIYSDTGTKAYVPNSRGPYSNAMAINDKHQIVGAFIDYSKNAYIAALWSNNTLTNLGTLGGNGSWAYDLNENNQIVGWARRKDDFVHATIWNENQIKDLGTLGGNFSFAYGINNFGQVVGMSTKVGVLDDTYATLWDGDSIINLNDYLDSSYSQEGWILREAMEINDSGWIVGNAFNRKLNLTKGYVLSVSSVPEVSTHAMLLVAFPILVCVFRRKRVTGQP